jgi:hypothetical protein
LSLSRRSRTFLITGVCGIAFGAAITFMFTRPPGPLELRFVKGAPVSQQERDRDGHLVRVYLVPGDLDQVEQAAESELQPSQGWQPATLRSKDPKVVQITRVKSPRGDFQFVRVLIQSDSSGKVKVTLDEGPIQRNAFQ